MPFMLSPVFSSDIPSAHYLSLLADQDSPAIQVFFPHHTFAAPIAHLMQHDEKDMRNPKSATCRVMVREVLKDEESARKEKGEVVDYVAWNSFARREEEGGGEDYAAHGNDERPNDVNQEALKVLVERSRKKRGEIMGKGEYTCITPFPFILSEVELGSSFVHWGKRIPMVKISIYLLDVMD